MSTLMDQARNRVPRFAEAAVERARLTVVPRPMGRSRRAARVPFVTLMSLLLVAGVAGLLFFNTSMQQVSFTVTSLEQKAQVLDAQRQSLQMRLDTLRDPQRVALQAKRMGMVPPASPAFIKLGTGRVLGKPIPASSEDSFRVTSMPTKKPKHLAPAPVIIEEAPKTDPASGGAARADGRSATGTKKAHPHQTDDQGSQR